jgi:uncharacterized protein YndB with AHSA1/START domain
VYGDLDQNEGRWVLQFVRRLPHPPEKVWRALTEPEHLKVWFPADIEGERKEGAPLRFLFRNNEGPDSDGEFITYDPPNVLQFRWGDELLRFDLEADGSGTVLRFLNTFDELGKAARDAAGWHACLDILGHHVDGEEPPWRPEERWAEVHEWYVEKLGPEAAMIGPPESMNTN